MILWEDFKTSEYGTYPPRARFPKPWYYRWFSIYEDRWLG